MVFRTLFWSSGLKPRVPAPKSRATRAATRSLPCLPWLKPPASLSPTPPRDHVFSRTLATPLGLLGTGRRSRSDVLINSKTCVFDRPGIKVDLGLSLDPARDRYRASNSQTDLDGLRYQKLRLRHHHEYYYQSRRMERSVVR